MTRSLIPDTDECLPQVISTQEDYLQEIYISYKQMEILTIRKPLSQDILTLPSYV